MRTMRRPVLMPRTRSVENHFGNDCFKADDPEELADAIRRLHADPVRAEQTVVHAVGCSQVDQPRALRGILAYSSSVEAGRSAIIVTCHPGQIACAELIRCAEPDERPHKDDVRACPQARYQRYQRPVDARPSRDCHDVRAASSGDRGALDAPARLPGAIIGEGPDGGGIDAIAGCAGEACSSSTNRWMSSSGDPLDLSPQPRGRCELECPGLRESDVRAGRRRRSRRRKHRDAGDDGSGATVTSSIDSLLEPVPPERARGGEAPDEPRRLYAECPSSWCRSTTWSLTRE